MKTTPNRLPPTPNQQRIWFLDQLQPGSPVNNETLLLVLLKNWSPEEIQQALARLVERHGALRAHLEFTEGRLEQVLLDDQKIHLQIVPKVALRDALSGEGLPLAISKEAAYSFELTRGPLLRATLLLSQGDREQALLLVGHQGIVDKYSIEVLARDLFSFLEGEVPPSLESYQDISLSLQQEPSRSTQASNMAWWREKLKAISHLELATDYPRPSAPSHRCLNSRMTLAGTVISSLKRVATEEDTAPTVVLLALLRTLLARSTSQIDLAIGLSAPVPRRASAPLHCGPFSSPLALRLNLDLSSSLRVAIQAERRALAEAEAHGDVPFNDILELLRLERDMTRHPLFQVHLQVSEENPAQASWLQGKAERIHLPPLFSLYDLSLLLSLQGDVLDGWISLSADLFRPSTTERIARQFEALLSSALSSPDAPLASLPLLNQGERDKILHTWNQTDAEYPSEALLHELFEEQAARTPDFVAVEFEGERLTYRQLNEKANQLAHYLGTQGIGGGTLVGVCQERSLAMIVSLFAILKAGGAYVALDPEYPRDRLLSMIEDAAPAVVLTQDRFRPLFPTSRTLAISEVLAQIHDQPTTNPTRQTTPDGIAYVIFTSGSTGKPKGVMNHHRGICNRIWWMQQAYRLTPEDAVLQKTPFSFDVSVWEFFWPTMAGARLVVCKPGGHRDPDYLVRMIQEHRITTLHFVPSMLQIWLDTEGARDCHSLRRVICSGEAMNGELQRKFFETCSGELHNLYGPTEAAIDVTAWKCQREDQGHTVPLGRPISNIQLYILDEYLQPVPIGFPGELFIGGVGVAKGYINQPKLTSERFLPDPFRPGGTIYRTGDVCRWREDGIIEYLGRADFQVKIRGFRIELGEIEQTLLQVPSVSQAAVVARTIGTSKQLVAYLAPASGQTIRRGEVRDYLQKKLPDYMVPSVLMVLPSLPLSPNGKLDRKALPEPDLSPETRRQESTPRNEIERQLSGIWATLLGLESVGIHDNFFELGGHSLLVMQMLFQIRTTFGEQLSVHSIFNAPTISQLAKLLTRKSVDNPPPSIRVPPADLVGDSILSPTISAADLPPLEDGPPTNVLLTGASGFLGAFLAHELLQRPVRKVFCLVRAESPEAAMGRIRHNLQKRGLWWDTMAARIEAIPADLSKARFGLEETSFQRLSREVDTILHNGALVDFVRPYLLLKPANVDGTVEILRLATSLRKKPVHFVSTLSVYPPLKNGEDRIEREDSDLDFLPERLHGGYAQSKWVGERLCFQARERDLPVNIYRPGVILGPSGIGNAMDFFHMLVKGCIQLGLAPRLDIPFNLTPADYVAPAIVEILFSSTCANRSYNLVNSVRLRWPDLLSWLSEQGYEFSYCSYADWITKLRQNVEQGEENVLASLLYFLTEMPQETLNFPWFSSTETEAVLRGTPITCPLAEPPLLTHWLNDLQRSGFLPRPLLE
jgi:amino acid adenylation domain-containing protein/thioester reductase-like protein